MAMPRCPCIVLLQCSDGKRVSGRGGKSALDLHISCKWKWKWSRTVVWLFATPWTVAHQAPPFVGFSRQEYWSGLPFSSPGDLPEPGIKPRSPALQADALTSEPPGKPPISATRYPLIMLPLSSFVWHHHPQWDYLLSAELRDLGQLCCC